jgi:putative glutamine amidotransferase
MHRPLIGVTLDHAPGGPPDVFSRFDHYALREHYFAAIARAGGLPVGIGHEAGQADAIMNRLDGLVVTGGAFDIAPDEYGGGPAHALTAPRPRRTLSERALMEAALATGRPVFGICGGMQLLAVVFGGTLIQHIPDAIEDALAHEQPNPRDEAGHDVRVLPDTMLAAITGRATLSVNSSHHQAVRDPGRAIVSALASDGVIEAIEYRAAPFAMGVQWHPEFAIDPADAAIFAAFVKASGDRA